MSTTATSPQTGPKSHRSVLSAGTPAPPFTLRCTPDQSLSLNELRLLADFEPKGAVARAYGVYEEKEGTCERALFVIDSDGTVHWSYLSPTGINPGANGILSALEDLKAKNETTAAAK